MIVYSEPFQILLNPIVLILFCPLKKPWPDEKRPNLLDIGINFMLLMAYFE